MNHRITITSEGTCGVIAVDGAQIKGVIGIDVKMRLSSCPVVSVDLLATDSGIELADAEVVVNSCAFLLSNLGNVEAVERALLAHLQAKYPASP